MKKLLSQFMVMVLLFSVISFSFAEESSLDEELARILKRRSTTGSVLVCARGGKILYELDYGFARKNQEIPVTPGTYFRTASVTKLISAVGVMHLVEKGLLSLDEPIGTYLGFNVENPYYDNAPVTLRMLMSHTSSIAQPSGYGKKKLSEILTVKSGFYQRLPGSQYEYSNFGAGIMGSLIEAVTGKTVDAVLHECLFDPLDIHAAYHPSLLPDPENVADVYKLDGSRKYTKEELLSRNPYPSDTDPEMHYRQTIGSVYITGRDLCRIGMMLVQGGEIDGVRILEKDTVDEMMSSQYGKGGITCKSPYGLCINIIDSLVEGVRIYGHQGLDDDILCNLYFEPETQFVFAFISNGTANSMDNRIAYTTRKLFEVVWKEFAENYNPSLDDSIFTVTDD